MLSNRSIGSKLLIAYCLFLAPIGFLGYRATSDSEAKIGFAAKELMGVHYVAAVRDIQDQVARGADMGSLEGAIGGIEEAFDGELNTAGAAQPLITALEGPDRGAAVQAAADLIGKSAASSNLTLDPDLDSFYTQDALTVKIPTIVAGFSRLVSTVAGSVGRELSVDEQVAVGVQVGALKPAMDGLAADIVSAVGGNPDKTVDGAVTPAIDKVTELAKSAMAALADHAKAGEADAIAHPLLDAVSAAGAADAVEVEHLLNARIDGFRRDELINGGIALALFMGAVGYASTVVQRGTVGPLRRLTVTMRKLAAHDLSAEIADAERGDEVGGMSRAVIALKEQMVARRRLNAEAETARALRDRQHAAIGQHTQDFGQSVTGVLVSLGTSASTLHQAAQDMAASVEQTHCSTASTAVGAEMNSSRLSGVAAATEELTASVDEIARQVSNAAQVARSTVEQADVTGAKVLGLSEAIGQIGDIVQLISNIAGQTNLLALNATIEAARAGEAGKGFAVVASEVKQLATQTRSATEQISAQLGAIQAAAEKAIRAVRGVGKSILQMDEVTATIAAAVEEQGAATREIAAHVQAVSLQNEECARSMQDVAGVAERAKQAGKHVLVAGDEIGRVSDALRQEVAHFLAALRIAENDRRNWVRLPAGRAAIVLAAKNGRRVTAELIDISRGGALVECGGSLAAGADVVVELPGPGGPVTGRVFRVSGTSLGIVFQQDPMSVACIEAAMTAIRDRDVRTGPGLAAAA
jgi:methyl-accepting chemotaxis protein